MVGGFGVGRRILPYDVVQFVLYPKANETATAKMLNRTICLVRKYPIFIFRLLPGPPIRSGPLDARTRCIAPRQVNRTGGSSGCSAVPVPLRDNELSFLARRYASAGH
jgi:hypothetical protein